MTAARSRVRMVAAGTESWRPASALVSPPRKTRDNGLLLFHGQLRQQPGYIGKRQLHVVHHGAFRRRRHALQQFFLPPGPA